MPFKKASSDAERNTTVYRVKAMGIGPRLVQGDTFQHSDLGKYDDNDEGRAAQDEHITNLLNAGAIEHLDGDEAKDAVAAPDAPATIITPAGDAIPLDQPVSSVSS